MMWLTYTMDTKEKVYLLIFFNVFYLVADSEGLFRISGSKKRQEELKDIINKGACSQKLSQYTPHDIASVLKQFLGALGEPLLTKQLYECYQQIAGKLKG